MVDKFNELSQTIETWELHPDFHSVPFQIYKTTGSGHGLQQRENQMKCEPFATQLNENLNAKQAALSNKVYNHLSFKENLSNEDRCNKNFNKC